jgi:hypothetical protein
MRFFDSLDDRQLSPGERDFSIIKKFTAII